MDERMRDVEGDIGLLKEWRKATVDPWIREDVATHKTIKTYMDQAEARELLMDKLSQERHESNTFKMNVIIVVGTLLLVLFGAWTLFIMIQTAKHQGLLSPLDFNTYAPQFAQRHEFSTIPPLTR